VSSLGLRASEGRGYGLGMRGGRGGKRSQNTGSKSLPDSRCRSREAKGPVFRKPGGTAGEGEGFAVGREEGTPFRKSVSRRGKDPFDYEKTDRALRYSRERKDARGKLTAWGGKGKYS